MHRLFFEYDQCNTHPKHYIEFPNNAKYGVSIIPPPKSILNYRYRGLVPYSWVHNGY